MKKEISHELSAQDIEYLKSYAKEWGINYLDVQAELIDHLATSIEAKQLINPDLELKKAMEIIMLDFPHSGFYHFESQARKSLKEYWENQFKQYLMQYFKLPKILIFLLITVLFYSVFKVGGSTARNLTGFSLLGIWVVFGIKEFFWGLNNRHNRSSFLFIRKYYQASAGLICSISILPFYVGNLFVFGESMSIASCIFYASFIAMEFLCLHAIMFVFPDYLKSDVRKKYGHLNIKFA